MKQFLSVVLAIAALAIAPSAHADPTPSFGYVAPGWFTVGAFDLSAFWHQAGFQESGISYAYIGGPDQSGYAGRFDPLGTTYEAFFGAYTISSFKYASDWNKPNLKPSDIANTANELIALGLVDQAVWLAAYGLPGAQSSPIGSPIIVPAGNGFFSISFAVQTFSDLGAPTSLYGFDPPYSLFANDVPAYEPVVAEASVLMKCDPSTAICEVVYGSGANYQVDGHAANTPLATLVQIGRMMAATTFQ